MSAGSKSPADMPKKVRKVKSTESQQSLIITGPAARQELVVSSGNGIDLNSSAAGSIVEGAADLGSDVYNCASVILYCTKHDVYALSEVKSKSKSVKGLTLPTVYVSTRMGFAHSISSKLKSMLANERSETGHVEFDSVAVLQKIRIQLPFCKKYVARSIFRTSISKDAGMCCKDVDNKSVKWFSLEQMMGMMDVLWGPEPVHLIYFLKKTKQTPVFLIEISLKSAMPYLPREAPTNEYERFLKQVGFTEPDVTRLLNEFIQHAYPERFMSQKALIKFLRASKWVARGKEIDEASVYRAFSMERLPYIQFFEFLLGLAASEPGVKHEGVSASVRNRCIVRYYDVNEDEVVDKAELRILVSDSLAAAGENANVDMIAELTERYASADGSKLREALAKNTIAGCSNLFRGSRSFLRCSESQDPIVYEKIDPNFDPRSGKQRDTEDQKCDKCLEKKYMVAPYKIQLSKKEKNGKGGQVVNPIGGVKKDELKYTDNKDIDPAKKERFASNIDEHSNERQILKSMPACEWLKEAGAADKILQLCLKVLPLVKAEGSLVELATPCYVFGAATGSANHLNQISQIIFPRLPMFELGSFMFLGNFLAAGESKALQCLIFMLAHKALCPQRFVVLRGSAEAKNRNDLQAQVKRLINDEKASKHVCKELFNILDQLPIAAVINNDVLCVSSGIPRSAERLTDISDSDAAESVKNKIALEILSPDLPKDTEIESTLSKLNISHVIRSGKEHPDIGYSYRLNGMVITLAASGPVKPPGIAFVNDSKIRLASIEL